MKTRELDHRINDGLDIRMLWDPGENKVTVVVRDARNGEVFEVEVGPGDSARDVFNHPFAYEPSRRIVLAPAALADAA
jgi:hypothetical protein